MDIFKIVRKNDVHLFETVTKDNVEVMNLKDRINNTLLLKAIFWNCNNIAEYLINRDIQLEDKDIDGYDIVSKAILGYNKHIVEYLTKENKIIYKDEDLLRWLKLANDLGNCDIFSLLYNSSGIDIEHSLYIKIKQLPKIAPGIANFLHSRGSKIKEPLKLYVRDDLIDSFTFEDIEPGTEYAVRLDLKDRYYCMGTRKTIEDMCKKKYKVDFTDMVFDMISNKPVTLNSVMYCIKLECPDIVKKIYNDTFTKEDYIKDFVDTNYKLNLYELATKFNSKKTLEILKSIES